MANEIKFSLNLSVANGNFTDSFNQSGSITQSVVGFASGIFDTTTSATDVPMGNSIVTTGVCMLKNLDVTNSIDYGPDISGFQVFGKLKPGESAVFRIKPSTVLMAKSEAGTPQLLFKVWND